MDKTDIKTCIYCLYTSSFIKCNVGESLFSFLLALTDEYNGSLMLLFLDFHYIG